MRVSVPDDLDDYSGQCTSNTLGDYLEYCRYRAKRKYHRLKLARKGVLISPKEHNYVPVVRRNELYRSVFRYFKERLSKEDYQEHYREIAKVANETYEKQSAPFVDLIRNRLDNEQMVKQEMSPIVVHPSQNGRIFDFSK